MPVDLDRLQAQLLCPNAGAGCSLNPKGYDVPRKKKDPAFLLYPKDFMADPNVAAMDNTSLGAYLRLLCYCWIDGEIPAAEESLRKLAQAATKQDWVKIKKEVLPLFKTRVRKGNKTVLIHQRLDQERRKLRKKSELRRLAATKRWEPFASRLHMQKPCIPIAIATANDNPSKSLKKGGDGKRSEPEAFRIQEMVEEKLVMYGAAKKHKNAGLYHMMGQYLPEPVVMAALARVNDKVMEGRAGGSIPKDLHRYFIGVVRSICIEQNHESPINWK